MRGVLTIAVLLRFMDSFLIYTEPFVLTGGGPGDTTTFLSIYLVKLAVGEFDVGKAAAFSIIYFLIVLVFSYVFYQVLLRAQRERFDEISPDVCNADALAVESDLSTARANRQILEKHQLPLIWLLIYLLVLLLPIYWMLNMLLRDNNDIMSRLALFPDHPVIHNYVEILTDPSWYSGYINSFTYVVSTWSSRSRWRCRRPMPSRATASSATSTCSSGC